MALNEQDQRRLDQLRYEKLLAEKQSAQAAPARRQTATSQLDKDRELLRSEAGRKELTDRAAKGDVRARGNIGALADIGLEAGGATAGQMIGAFPALSVPSGGLSVPIGGALMGMGGNIAAQNRRMAAGEQDGFKLGQLLSTGLVSAIPGGPAIGAGGRALAREGIKQGAGGLAGKTVETAIDEGQLPSLGEAAFSTLVPSAGGALAQRIGARNADALSNTERGTLEAGKRAGYVVTPSSVSDSSLNKRVESVAGKAAVGQEAARRNQEVTNRLAKRALGIPDNTELTMPTLRRVRAESGVPYSEVEALSQDAATRLRALEDSINTQAGGDAHQLAVLYSDPQVVAQIEPLRIQASADIQALRQARNESVRQWESYRRTASPEAMERAMAAGELAESLENGIEAAANSAGNADLVQRLRAARQRIARTYDVERALNLGTEDVSAPVIGRALDKGRPLTEELATVGRMAEAYPSVMREGTKIPTPGVSKVEAGAAALLATLGAGATQSPAGLALGALPLLSGPARSLVLSRPYQDLLTNAPLAMPNAGTATRILAQEAGNEFNSEEESEPKKKKKP